jgi:hypothetical protein
MSDRHSGRGEREGHSTVIVQQVTEDVHEAFAVAVLGDADADVSLAISRISEAV